MKAKALALTLALCFAGAASSLAQSPQLGTWKLNEAKSKMAAGAPKNTTVTYDAQGDEVKVTTEGTSGDGQPMHTEWTGKFDGKDYPASGVPDADSRSYKAINEHTLMMENKKNGKVTTSGRIVVAADGKSRTVTAQTTDSAGKKVSSTAVYDKE